MDKIGKVRTLIGYDLKSEVLGPIAYSSMKQPFIHLPKWPG